MATNNSTRAIFDDDEWVYPVDKNYQHYLCECMSLKHGHIDDIYPRTLQFSKEELLELNPSDIRRYILWKAYGDPYADDTKDEPRNARSGSLRKAKQGVSWFMPNKNVAWIEGMGGSLNKVIDKVEELETKGKGVPPNDKRAYNEREFDFILAKLRSCHDFDTSVKYVTMTLWAYNLIHRLDDTSNFKVSAPHGNSAFPFTIKTRTRWSKNVKKMRHCPDQIMLASMDWKSCVITALAIYLEQWLAMHPTAVYLFTESHDEEKGLYNVKKNFGNSVRKLCWDNAAFQELNDKAEADGDKGLGTHSERKCACDSAKKKGARTRQTEYRGRWLGDKRHAVVDRVYQTAEEPFTDAYVASLLCRGGPVKLELNEGVIGVTDDWLALTCVPNIKLRYDADPRFVRVMGLAVLWASFDEDCSLSLPAVQVDAIRSSFNSLHSSHQELEGNPVARIRLSIIPVNEWDVDIIETPTEGLPTGAPPPGATRQQGMQQEDPISNVQLLAVLQEMKRDLQQQLEGIRTEQGTFKPWARENFKLVIKNQQKYGGYINNAFAHQDPRRQRFIANENQAIARQRTEPPARELHTTPRVTPTTVRVRQGINPHAKLEKNLRNLTELWTEYMFGVGDNKAAKDWTTDEKNGQGKPTANKYCRRMKIWRIQAYLLGVGYSIEAANDRIIEVYGTDKITTLTVKITHEQKNPNYQFLGGQRFNPRFIVNTS